jgi:hypothetical protein
MQARVLAPQGDRQELRKIQDGYPGRAAATRLDLSLRVIEVVLAERAADHQHLGALGDGGVQDSGRTCLRCVRRADRNE